MNESSRCRSPRAAARCGKSFAHVPRCIAVGSGLTDADSAHELISALQQLTVAMRDLRDHPQTVLDAVGARTPPA